MGITPRRFALVFIAALAVAMPVGMSVAAKESPQEQNDRAMAASFAELREVGADPDPDMSFEERHEKNAAAMLDIAERAAKAAGGRLVESYPPGVVFRADPNRLDEVDPEEYASFCARVAKTNPDDHSCELNYMAQAGEIRPGYYTQEDIEAVIKEEK